MQKDLCKRMDDLRNKILIDRKGQAQITTNTYNLGSTKKIPQNKSLTPVKNNYMESKGRDFKNTNKKREK